MSFNWVAHTLVNHPYYIIGVVGFFSGMCVIIPLVLKAPPDFSDPQMGFETRGTTIANRLTAWKNLREATQPSGLLTVNPKGFLAQKKLLQQSAKKQNKERNSNKGEPTIFVSKFSDRRKSNNSKELTWLQLQNLIKSKSRQQHPSQIMPPSGYLCGRPDDGYAQLVLKSLRGEDLFTLKSLIAMCSLEEELIQSDHYKDLCVEKPFQPKQCCKPWSLGNYIALMRDRSSCLAITEEDVDFAKDLLQRCSPYYHDFLLTSDCSDKGNCKVPVECTQHDAVFNIMNYITSTSFLPDNDTSELVLEETMIFLPLARSLAIMPYYKSLDTWKYEYKGISVVAMDFGIKSALFDEYLLRDAWLMSSGCLFVLLCMWLYTGSFFLTVVTIIAIIFSLGISYFLYVLVFEHRFFPFMNLLATIVAIGIGCDDAFIFCKIWKESKKGNTSLLAVMTDTFHHAFLSMLVTSITTATAFLASYVSRVTAIGCFSAFAGMAVVANCFLMMSWFPACVVAWENYSCSTWNSIKRFLARKVFCIKMAKNWRKALCVQLRLFKQNYLMSVIINFRYFWVLIFSLIAIGSAYIVLYYPKLQLPNSAEFQLFDSSHPFEQYDLTYKEKFWFKRIQKADSFVLPMRFVWGVLPEDNGDPMNPYERGDIVFDHEFDISEPNAQEWLLQFCRNLRKQPFYQTSLGPLLPNCFIESFISWMQRRCLDKIYNVDHTPCCEDAKFPYNKTIFESCIIEATSDLYETPVDYFMPGVAGPKFSKEIHPIIRAVVVEYDSNYFFTMSFNRMHEFYTQVETWMQTQLKQAPETMKRGWFISDLDFYDVQKELSECTLAAIAFSMGLALTVLLLSTLNIVTSFLAIFSITCSILVTMAVLVLLDWKLNVLESIAVSTSIGLTVDFSLHYTVNYRLAPNTMSSDRQAATKFALSHVVGPACMAAVTTGAAGAFMLPSSILAYIQIGIFLVTVMTVSWLFSTFHLCSLLAIVGPENYYGQFHYSRIYAWMLNTYRNQPPEPPLPAELHELDSLTSNYATVPPVPNELMGSSIGGSNDLHRYILTDQSSSVASSITTIVTPECN